MGIFSILRESFVNMWEDLSIFLVNSDCQYLGENMNIFALKPIFELFKFLWGSLKYLGEFYQFFGPILNWGKLLIFWASFILSNDKILIVCISSLGVQMWKCIRVFPRKDYLKL